MGEGEVGGFTLRAKKQWLYLGVAAVRPWLALGGSFLLCMNQSFHIVGPPSLTMKLFLSLDKQSLAKSCNY